MKEGKFPIPLTLECGSYVGRRDCPVGNGILDGLNEYLGFSHGLCGFAVLSSFGVDERIEEERKNR